MSFINNMILIKVAINSLLLLIALFDSIDGVDSQAATASNTQTKREADYSLDDSYWIEETPAGEVERLLREYKQNQEMVKNIGTHYYQIIYPVQLRQHKKMGISTREIGGSPKVRIRRSLRGQDDGRYLRPRQRTGKHFHRTSLLIKAFNHKFRLDLELNTQLLAPNIMQKHFLTNGAEQVSKQEIEHCYYHGTVQDYPGATAAFHTCNGVSGVIHVGNETFVIHPFYGGDLSQKHPHVIFEARTNASKGCANSGNMASASWRPNAHSGFFPKSSRSRFKRDVREATKYIETALIIDKAMFEKRNGSTRAEVVHDSIQVANIADLYFRTLNTRVSVVYIETWQGSNQVQIDRTQDIARALSNFNDYTSRKLFKVDKDTTQLLTGEVFVGGEAGMAVPGTVCTSKSVGINVDINPYEPHLLAGTMAHMIGHNIGMGHDDGRAECYCRDWHGCIMAQAIVGLDNVQPYKFSECSRSDYIDRLRTGNGICLLNKPNELEVRRTCGNRIVEEGEDCDCGTIDECPNVDPCCDPITCKLTTEAECASGPCCDKCRLRERGWTCRKPKTECDLPEYCTGEAGDCPIDVHKKNGNPCGENTGYCFNGVCPTLALQCEEIWGRTSNAADVHCYEEFNSKGAIDGHCGKSTNGNYNRCSPENVLCGSLQCQLGSRFPTIEGLRKTYSRTITTHKGKEYECKATSGASQESDLPLWGLVRDGTPCGDNLICLNQTCSSIFPHIDQTKCPSNHNNAECSGHGLCTNMNKCFCEEGWSGPDCSIQIEVEKMEPTAPTAPPDSPKRTADFKGLMKTRVVNNYETEDTDHLSTLSLVFILVGMVKGVFICFAVAAICYRKTTVQKYTDSFKTVPKKYSIPGNQEDNSMISGNNGSLSRGDSQRVLFRPANHLSAAGSSHCHQDHKVQQHSHKRLNQSTTSDEDQIHSVDDDTVSFIDLQHNNLKHNTEKKGILKKHAYGLMMGANMKESPWNDGTQSDGIISRSDSNVNQLLTTASMSEVERTLKSLNGYHDDIVQALRNAASRRVSSTTPHGSQTILNDDILRRSLQECISSSYPDYKRSSSQEKVCEPQIVVEAGEEDDEVPPCGPIRIRNLEDLIRQLEHHSRHMSPSGSEDIRMSETETDRHYRQESSSACSESSHQSHRDRDSSRFVYGSGRFRQMGSRLPYPHPHLQNNADEDSIYESADHDRGLPPCGDTPDSESDDFIQAQQQLARWASEDVVMMERGQPGPSGPSPREYFPSPSSSASEEPSSIVRAPVPVPTLTSSSHPPEHATIHRPKRYPEYKH